MRGKRIRIRAAASAGEKVLAALLLACLIALAPALHTGRPQTAEAASANMNQEDLDAIERARQQMEEIGKQAEELSREQNRIASQQRSILGDMKVLSDQMSVLEREIGALNKQITDREKRVDILGANIVVKTVEVQTKTGEVNQRREYLDQRLLQIYRDGDISVLDVLFSSASLTDFLTCFDLMEKIVENDMGLLKDLQQAKAELEAQKAELEAQAAELEEEKAGLEGEKGVRQGKRDELNRQWSVQNRMSRELAADIATLEAAEEELLALSRQLEKFIAEIQGKYQQSYMGSGSMAWPVPGWSRISSPYGYRNHPILRTNRFHAGIDIPANSGTPVLAAETGRVIMAQSYGGYGNCVILDHGGGVSTVYGHLVRFNVTQGQLVIKGERIAGVGTTGLSTGNHLHFEIRVNGSTVDPQNHSKYNVKAN